MAIEDQIRSSIATALQGLVDDILQQTTAAASQRLSDAEARFSGSLEDARVRAREEGREAATREHREYHDADTIARNDAHAAALTATQRAERDSEASRVGVLLASVRRLDEATSLIEILDALALAVSGQTSRSVVLLRSDGHMAGWRLNGFGEADAHPASVTVRLDESGVVGCTVGLSATVHTTHEISAPDFAMLSPQAFGVAVPVMVGGQVVACIYADNGPTAIDGEPAWPDTVEVLARHAGRCLEAFTGQRASAATTPRVSQAIASSADEGAGTEH